MFSKQAILQSMLLPGLEYFNWKQLTAASHVALKAIQAISTFRQLTKLSG
jgi:hypothetical protein